ncbi:hypothetical protein [Streptococcus ruminantium]|uniref:hypothetical protein n=1 Tax=Streptococcus ruminantium TaxID=1917441 RepID=UPI0012DFBE89|nr:hypothetical protein [Streptococcus ruminantium]
MSSILVKKYVNYRCLLLTLFLFVLVHVSGKYLLDTDFEISVLNYHLMGYRTFYTIGKYLFPYVYFLCAFVYRIDMTDQYFSLVFIRSKNKYRHIISISGFIFLASLIYWGAYLGIFYFISGRSSFAEVFVEYLIVECLTLQLSGLYFFLDRWIGHTHTAAVLTICYMGIISFQSSIADTVTSLGFSFVSVSIYLVLIFLHIQRKGVVRI